MSGIKASKVGREIKGSKRSEKLRKAKFSPAGSDISELVSSKLLLTVDFGAVVGRHFHVGFNSIMRQLESDSIDAVVVSQQAPATIMQMLYEAILMQNLRRKIDSVTCRNTDAVSLLIISNKSLVKFAEKFKMKRISCIGLRRKAECSDANDDHVYASMDTAKEILTKHSICQTK